MMADQTIAKMAARRAQSPVTADVLADELSGLEVLHAPEGSRWAVAWCLDASAACGAGLRANGGGEWDALDAPGAGDVPFPARSVLLAGRLAQLDELATANPDCPLALLAGPSETLPAALARPDGLSRRVLVLRDARGELDVAGLTSRLLLAIYHVQLWHSSLLGAADAGGTLQDLVDLAEPMLGNFIHVSDATFTLLAYTRGIEPPAGLNAQLVRQGYHDRDVVRNARFMGLFDSWKQQTDVRLFDPTDEIPCPFYTYVLRAGDAYLGHVVMTCNARPSTPGIRDLFAAFVNVCCTLLQRERKAGGFDQPPAAGLVERLLADARCNQSFIDSQAQLAGLPAVGAFRLCLVDYAESPYASQPYYLASLLRDQLPEETVLLHDDALLMLSARPERDRPGEASRRRTLERLCAETGCCAYLSDPFGRLRDLRFAYRQVRATQGQRLVIDVSLRPLDDLQQRRVFTFDGAFPHVCESSGFDDEFKDFCVSHSPLSAMAAAPPSSDVNDVRLLYCYLFNERRATPCSQQLGMHRNSVVYRIRQLEERYDLDLDSLLVRERLLATFRMKIERDATFRDLLV